jgi:hypothetical protein
MPRKARIDAPGALHHVIVRGIERGKIFRSDYDRRNFLNRLGKLIPETQTDSILSSTFNFDFPMEQYMVL